jgi:branched-chain amino acid transport system substrate-binding protein
MTMAARMNGAGASSTARAASNPARSALAPAVTLAVLASLVLLLGCGTSAGSTATSAAGTSTSPSTTVTTAGAESTGTGSGASTSPGQTRTVTIGALLSLTGEWSDLGKASQAALQLAAAKVNADLANQGIAFKVALVVEDTRLDPALCLEKLQTLAAQGIAIVIGPQSSAEVLAIKPFADENGILVISQSSTAGSLSLPGDNIFRFCPGDGLEGAAVAALMWVDGIRAIVPMWRGDAGNEGLGAAVRRSFAALGGKVADGVSYAPETTDFAASVGALRTQVSALESAGAPQEQVGVYLAAFDEVVGVFKLAKEEPLLSALHWYGSDGAKRTSVVSDPAAAEFALAVGYPNPMLGLDRSREDAWKPVTMRIQELSGVTPDAFALCAYDALVVAVKALQQAGGYANSDTLKRSLVSAANSGAGLTGQTTLNDAGDRVLAEYDFWAPKQQGTAITWSLVATYKPGTAGSNSVIQRVTAP